MFGYADVTDVFRIKNLCTAFTTYIGEHYHFVGERHDFWELVIVIDGEVGVTAGERTSVLRKGEAILHYPMEFHRVWYAGNIPAEILIFSFAADISSMTALPSSILYPNGMCPISIQPFS